MRSLTVVQNGLIKLEEERKAIEESAVDDVGANEG
jgi:hypothetical protein